MRGVLRELIAVEVIPAVGKVLTRALGDQAAHYQQQLDAQAGRILELSMAQDNQIGYTTGLLTAAEDWCTAVRAIVQGTDPVEGLEPEQVRLLLAALANLDKLMTAAIDAVPGGPIEPDVLVPDDEEDELP